MCFCETWPVRNFPAGVVSEFLKVQLGLFSKFGQLKKDGRGGVDGKHLSVDPGGFLNFILQELPGHELLSVEG